MMIKISFLIVVLFLVYYGSNLERRSLYFPDRQMNATPAAYGLGFEELNLNTEDGMKIKGWFVPANTGGQRSAPAILFSHGNAGNISHRLEKLQIFHKIGLSVLLFDYRGYGQSEGVPSESGTYADADAAYRYLTEIQKIPPGQIILYGESLGCAVAVEMALRHPAAALILESPFTSTLEMAKRVFPWLPVRWIVRYHYDNLAKIPQVKMPLLIMHSLQDDIVPYAMGRKLFAAAHEPKFFFDMKGDHNGGFLETGGPYAKALRTFIKRLREM